MKFQVKPSRKDIAVAFATLLRTRMAELHSQLGPAIGAAHTRLRKLTNKRREAFSRQLERRGRAFCKDLRGLAKVHGIKGKVRAQCGEDHQGVYLLLPGGLGCRQTYPPHAAIAKLQSEIKTLEYRRDRLQQLQDRYRRDPDPNLALGQLLALATKDQPVSLVGEGRPLTFDLEVLVTQTIERALAEVC